jgi:MFS family permease
MIRKKNAYLPLIGSLYTNYIFQGIATIIISQNLNVLTEQWHTSVQQVTLVISSIGFGRILSLYFAGYFSDTFGRKRTVQLGVISYFIFFSGILISQNYLQGCVFAVFAGFSNAFLDTGTYPALVEAYPNEADNSSLSVLNKAFISVGQFILPIITRFVINHNLYYGYVFIACVIGLALNFLYTATRRFPQKAQELPIIEVKVLKDGVEQKQIPSFKKEGLALLVFSFTCVSTFNIFILWIPSFAESLNLMNHADSLMLVSAYSLGSFVSVFLTSWIVKKGAAPSLVLVWCTFISSILLGVMLLFPSFITLLLASIGIGVFAAGGIWQLGLSVLLELFPNGKGKITSYYSIATSVSVMLIPYITGQLEQISVSAIFLFNTILTAIGCIASVYIRYRYKQLLPATDKEAQSLRTVKN